jgi:hypothetical protein
MHKKDYEGNYIITTKDKFYLSICVLMLGSFVFFDTYILYMYFLR